MADHQTEYWRERSMRFEALNVSLSARLAEAETQNRVMWDVASDREARLAEAEALLRVMPGYGLSAYDKERWEKARNAFLAADSATHRENDSHE